MNNFAFAFISVVLMCKTFKETLESFLLYLTTEGGGEIVTELKIFFWGTTYFSLFA
jgi:hypothetical protein